jgi:hypothetical protein
MRKVYRRCDAQASLPADPADLADEQATPQSRALEGSTQDNPGGIHAQGRDEG